MSSVRRVEIRKGGEANRDLTAAPPVTGAQSVLGAGETQTLVQPELSTITRDITMVIVSGNQWDFNV